MFLPDAVAAGRAHPDRYGLGLRLWFQVTHPRLL